MESVSGATRKNLRAGGTTVVASPSVDEILGDLKQRVTSGVFPLSELIVDVALEHILACYTKKIGNRRSTIKHIPASDALQTRPALRVFQRISIQKAHQSNITPFLNGVSALLCALWSCSFYGYIHGPYRDTWDVSLAKPEKYRSRIQSTLQDAKKLDDPNLQAIVRCLTALAAHHLDALVQPVGHTIDCKQEFELLVQKIKVHHRFLNSDIAPIFLRNLKTYFQPQELKLLLAGHERLKQQLENLNSRLQEENFVTNPEFLSKWKKLVQQVRAFSEDTRVLNCLTQIGSSCLDSNTGQLLITVHQRNRYAALRQVWSHLPIHLADLISVINNRLVVEKVRITQPELEQFYRQTLELARLQKSCFPASEIAACKGALPKWLEDAIKLVKRHKELCDLGFVEMARAYQRWQPTSASKEKTSRTWLLWYISGYHNAFTNCVATEKDLSEEGSSTIDRLKSHISSGSSVEIQIGRAVFEYLEMCQHYSSESIRDIIHSLEHRRRIAAKRKRRARRQHKKAKAQTRRAATAQKSHVSLEWGPSVKPPISAEPQKIIPVGKDRKGKTSEQVAVQEGPKLRQLSEVLGPRLQSLLTRRHRLDEFRAGRQDRELQSLRFAVQRACEVQRLIASSPPSYDLACTVCDASRRIYEAGMHSAIAQYDFRWGDRHCLETLIPTHNLGVYYEILSVGLTNGAGPETILKLIQNHFTPIHHLAHANEIINYGEADKFASYPYTKEFAEQLKKLRCLLDSQAQESDKQAALERLSQEYLDRALQCAAQLITFLLHDQQTFERCDLPTNTVDWVVKATKQPAPARLKEVNPIDKTYQELTHSQRGTSTDTQQLIGVKALLDRTRAFVQAIRSSVVQGECELLRRQDERDRHLDRALEWIQRLHQKLLLHPQDCLASQWDALHIATRLIREIELAALWHHDAAQENKHWLKLPSPKQASIPLERESDVLCLHHVLRIASKKTKESALDFHHLSWLAQAHHLLNAPHVHLSRASPHSPFACHLRALRNLANNRTTWLLSEGPKLGKEWKTAVRQGSIGIETLKQQADKLQKQTQAFIIQTLAAARKVLLYGFS